MKPILQFEEWAVFVAEDSQHESAMLDLEHELHLPKEEPHWQPSP